MARDKIKDQILSVLESNKEKVYYFIKWYVDTERKDRNEKNYNNSCFKNTKVGYETVMSEWLLREDVQRGIADYLKTKRRVKMLDLYETMYEKALKGDVKSADWCANFFKSDFFENKSNQIDSFLNGIDIEGLNND